MGIFTAIPSDTFNMLQVDAGVLLSSFSTASVSLSNSDIITATTGGIQIECVPTFTDWGEDVDNCPNNTKELKHIDGWDCKIITTAIGADENVIKYALGAYTSSGGKVVPNRNLSQSDFKDLWWVGDRADGGCVAVKLINAISTGGMKLKTTKNGKGNIDLEFTGHVALSQQDVMPIEFYVISGSTTGSP